MNDEWDLEGDADDVVSETFMSEVLGQTCTASELSIGDLASWGVNTPKKLKAVALAARDWILAEVRGTRIKLMLSNQKVGSPAHKVLLAAGFKEYTRYNGQEGRIASMAIKIVNDRLRRI